MHKAVNRALAKRLSFIASKNQRNSVIQVLEAQPGYSLLNETMDLKPCFQKIYGWHLPNTSSSPFYFTFNIQAPSLNHFCSSPVRVRDICNVEI